MRDQKGDITGNATKNTQTQTKCLSHCNTRQDRDGESVGQSSGIEPSCKWVCRSQLQTFDIDKCEICQRTKSRKATAKEQEQENHLY